ncbi:MAG: 3-oxo-5-alpha-steroid 4-dehydrogenase [Alphaproteobacteria bacterium]|nr:3-oxo-5-alpha-steroid 4-dehydrogenase [Alphaproteobacteria bacterium]
MTGDPTYDLVLGAGLLLALVTAVSSLFVTTPYGRFASSRLGPTVPQRVGWMMMEAPALLVFPWVYLHGPRAYEPVPLFFAALWGLHYANRALFFPLTMRLRKGARMGLLVPGSGWLVVPMHAWLFATWYGRLGTHLTPAWWSDPRFLVGVPTYLVGLGLLLHSEAVLRGLRSAREVDDGDGSYKIPHGGGFAWVSSPHYLGELIAWAGIGIAAWNPGALFILTISMANLVPRAVRTHRWYHEHFPDYPAGRRALVPFVF